MPGIKAICAAAVCVLGICLGTEGVVVDSTAAKVMGRTIYSAHYENVLGTSLEMKIAARFESDAQSAEAAALREIDREVKILSSWDADSEFSRWFRTQGQPVPVSAQLFDVFDLFDKWRLRTGGALDASAEAVSRAWQTAASQNRLPTAAERESAVAQIGKMHWKLDFENRTATHLSTTPLAMNSFVKSYIVQHSAGAALQVPGVRGVVINIGGDLVVRGDLNERVNIADPRSDAENSAPIAQLLIRDLAVATSGNYRRGVEIGGQHYSHIVDPRTGMPSDEIISSTVVAPVAADAGALATAFSVLVPEESARLAAKMPGVEYLLMKKNGVIITSKGWSKLLAPGANQVYATEAQGHLRNISLDTKSALWNQDYQLTVGFTVSSIQGYRVTRPYVAIWIEDLSGHPVRTIALWFNKFRFLHELLTWYGDQLAYRTDGANNLANSISSATRPPGKYTVEWDGKDDGGKLVPAGKYLVFVEASREHGTHQWAKQEMDFNGTPKKVDLQSGVEIESTYLDYHKISH